MTESTLDNIFKSNGADLLREAITDWEQFCTNGQPFAEWFPEVNWIQANKLYTYDCELSGIEEVDE